MVSKGTRATRLQPHSWRSNMSEQPQEFPPCPKRSRLTQFKADGTKDHVQRCTEQEATKANQDVTPEDCIECPLRSMLVKAGHVPKTPKPRAKTPPRRDSAGGDLGFVSCGHRAIVDVKSCCGQLRVARVCDLDLCQYYQGEVNPSICAQCPLRQPQ